MEITVDTVTGRNITLKFENPELVKHVNICVKTEMLIFVETGGEKLELKVDRTQTVGNLKQLIVQMKKNMSFIGGNSLQYLGNKLQDSKTLADYDIKEGSTLQLVTSPTIPNMLRQQQQQVVTNPTVPNVQKHQQQQQVVTNPTIPNVQLHQQQQQVVTNPTIPNMQQHQQRQQVVTNPTIPNMLLDQQQKKFEEKLLRLLHQKFPQQILQLQQKLERAEALASMNAKTAS